MNFGYLIFVSTNDKIDYLNLAYALALSIKNTQKEGYDKVCLMTDDVDAVKKLKSSWVFDHVEKIEKYQGWDARSWMDTYSPFDYTVCLDSDMLFTRDYSHWIDYFVENNELYIANTAYTYREELVDSDYYRRTFTKNKLPNLYSFYTFFKKDSAVAKEFFTLARNIIENPVEFSNLFLTELKPKVVGTDEAFGLAAKLLDIGDDIAYKLEFPKVVHMKGMIQKFPWPSDVWSDHLGFYINRKGQIKIGNYQQHNIVHYVEKDKITQEVINILEEIAWKK
jgi:hypothetical protein